MGYVKDLQLKTPVFAINYPLHCTFGDTDRNMCNDDIIIFLSRETKKQLQAFCNNWNKDDDVETSCFI